GIRGMFTIAGVISSPEYIFVTKSEQDVMPLPRTFGVLFMAQPAAEKLFSLEGRVNEINLLVDNGVSHAEVSQKIEETLLRFGIRRVTFKNDPVSIETRKIDIVRGVRSAYVIEREDQIVNKLLKQDLESFQQMAFLFPMLFLSIASFTIYVLLSRLVESQRVQIGLMRGLGYTRLGILLHYTAFALIIGITGALLGALLGNYIGSWMTRFYVAQLNLPLTVIEISWSTTLGGIITGIAIPVIAGFIPAWSTMRLTPAIAMRPAAPASGHKLLIERILPFLSRMPYIFKLTLRNIFRRFRQTLFMALGVAFAVTLILVSLAFVDTFNNALYSQYDVVQQYDAVIYYQGMGSAATANYVQRLDGVERAEAVFQVPYRLRYRDTIVDTAVTGLPPASTMFNLKSPQGEKLEIADGGILLPQYLKRRFGAEIGDIVELEPLVGTVGSTQKQIIGYVDFFMGGRAFMSLSEVQEMTRSSGMATGIMMQFHSQPSEELIKRLYDLPGTASIEFVEDTRQYIDDQMAFFWAFIIFMLVMGTSLGVAIIFNSVTVNVLQRTREIAVMRVIGRRNSWITSIITMENIIVGLFGVIIGIPLGQYVAYYFMSTAGSMSEEAMTLNLYIGAHSYIIAVAMAMLMLLVSQMPAINQVRKMSLTTALKDWYE
ncbi:MAG TPA: FtsX-like permease family protein, partial [Dehalococcoidia bacterium]|nr:FtsX-like permease family protein [Dehalococcoidia bacterium]